MGSFAPEFAHHWTTSHDHVVDDATVAAWDDEGAAGSTQEALEALVERVHAARTVY